MMDGGIAEGTDVFKALALGAKFVFIGRPIIWGLAVDGQTGVEKILNIIKEEFDTCLALTGTTNVNDITQEYIVKDSLRSKL